MKREERLLLTGSNLWYMGEGMLGPLFAVFTERIGGSVLDIAWAWSVYLIVTGVATIIFGKLSDGMFSKRRMMMLGYALNAVFTFGYLLVHTPHQLLLVQVGLGIALALSDPTWQALYAKYETKKSAGYLWGLATGQASIITGLAMLVGGFIVTYHSFEMLFILMGCIQIVATVYQAQILKKRKRSRATNRTRP